MKHPTIEEQLNELTLSRNAAELRARILGTAHDSWSPPQRAGQSLVSFFVPLATAAVILLLCSISNHWEASATESALSIPDHGAKPNDPAAEAFQSLGLAEYQKFVTRMQLAASQRAQTPFKTLRILTSENL